MNTKASFQRLRIRAGTDNPYHHPEPPDPLTFATDLSQYYTRFDKQEFSVEYMSLLSNNPVVDGGITISETDVRQQLQRFRPKKAASPGCTSADLLRECADSLAHVQPLFQESVDSSIVPYPLEDSARCSYPPKRKPTELNHYRPVA